MLLTFTSADAANSAASCISRGFGRVKPRPGDRVYRHTNGDEYLAFDIDEGDSMKIRRVVAILPDGEEMHVLKGTYLKGAAA